MPENFLSVYTYFPKFSPSSIVSGNSQFIVSGSRKHNKAPSNGPVPNINGGNHGATFP